MKSNEPESQKVQRGGSSCKQQEAIIWPIPGLKEKPVNCAGISGESTFISASAVSYRGAEKNKKYK